MSPKEGSGQPIILWAAASLNICRALLSAAEQLVYHRASVTKDLRLETVYILELSINGGAYNDAAAESMSRFRCTYTICVTIRTTVNNTTQMSCWEQALARSRMALMVDPLNKLKV